MGRDHDASQGVGMLAANGTHRAPARPEPLVGRREEAALVRRLLQTSTRLVTLIGAPGVGKSIVAAAAAEGLARAVTGVWFVQLRDRGPGVATAVAHELRLAPGDDPARSVIEAIGTQDVLLVLDDVDALVDETSALLGALLGACPGVRAIVTSREPLSVPGQSLIAVGPLAHTALTASSDSVRLFTQSAVRHDARFELTEDVLPSVIAICETTGGVPLAIELAAAQLQFMDARTLARRMHDQLEALEPADPSSRSLRAAVEESWDRCGPDERRVWCELAVLAPGWDLELGEAMAALALRADPAPGGRPGSAAGAAVKQLIRRSVVHRRRRDGGARYELLPAIRDFGAAQADDPDGARSHLIACMIDRLQDAEDHWFSDRQAELLHRLQGDIPNIRRAVMAAAEMGRSDAAIEVAATGWRQAWTIHGRFDELGSWLDVALSSGEPSPYWAAVGHGLRSVCSAMTDRMEAAAEQLDAAIASRAAAAGAGVGAERQRTVDLALRSAQERLEPDDAVGVDMLEALIRDLGPEAYRFGRVNLPQRLAARLFLLDRWEEGLRVDDEITRRSLAVGDRYERSFALTTRATARSAAGDYAAAEADAREALVLKRGLGNGLGVAQALELLADVARERADAAGAATLLGCAAGRWRDAGAIHANYPPYFFDRAATERALRLRLGDPAFDRAFERGAALSEDESIDFALHDVAEARPRSAGTGPQESVSATVLTPRERQVASLVAEGDTNKAIARRLFVSIRTVESHVQNALVKLGLRSRTELAVWYREQEEQQLPTR